MPDTVTVTYSGPFWDGSADRAVEDSLDDIEKEVAQQGVNDVKQHLDSVLKNPTGNYERHIVTERQRNDWAVTDSGIVYGPWLEGVGSRNKSSRFKGYATFRKVRQQLDGKASDIGERVVSKNIRRMN